MAHATRAGPGLECAIAVAGVFFALPAVLVAQPECGARERETGFGCMRAEEVGFTSTGAELAGDWYTPLQGGRHPAVVLVHGAGAMDRQGPGGYLVETAGYFVSRGFAVLSFDKRGTGASNGDWRVMGFEDLAGDVAAAVRYVRSRADVDPGRVGLWGISQAGWVLPLAARLVSPAFVIAVSAAGTGVTPAEQNLYDIGHQARVAGLDDQERNDVLSAWRELYALVRSDRNPATEARFRRIRRTATVIQDAGAVLPPSAGSIRWEERDQWFLALDFDFDAVPVWAGLNVPVLAVYGGADLSTPTDRVTARFSRAMAGRVGGASIEIIAGGNHVLMDGRPGAGRLLAAYTSVMDAWLAALGASPPRTSGF